jgi:hypothetical protein
VGAVFFLPASQKLSIMLQSNESGAQALNEQNFTPIAFSYEGKNINFNELKGSVTVNATEMAKAFGKKPANWLRLDSTKEFLKALKESRYADVRNDLFSGDENLVKVIQGGSNQGTWMDEDVALEFSRWLSPAFAIWTNKHIKELLLEGRTSLNENKKGYPKLPPKRKHNRLTQQRLVSILADVAKIDNKEIRLSLMQKLGVC